MDLSGAWRSGPQDAGKDRSAGGRLRRYHWGRQPRRPSRGEWRLRIKGRYGGAKGDPMSLVNWASYHRHSIVFLLLVLSVGGAATAFLLPVSLFPHVNFPRIVVTIDSGDRPAEQMVISVTMPVEQAVRSVIGLQSIRSTTSRGSSELSLNFAWGLDMSVALLQGPHLSRGEWIRQFSQLPLIV
jgi:hypothetical protein